jgi:hypothetical protein
MNNYFNKIHLPLSIEHGIIPIDLSKNSYTKFDVDIHVQSLFKEWYQDMGLFWIVGGYFYTAPNHEWPPHLDGKTFTDFCKLNWFSNTDSQMEWYEPTGEFIIEHKISMKESESANTNYSLIDRTKLKSSFKTNVTENCMINGGRIHRFQNGNQPTHCVSVVLGSVKTGKYLTWDEGCEIFL